MRQRLATLGRHRAAAGAPSTTRFSRFSRTRSASRRCARERLRARRRAASRRRSISTPRDVPAYLNLGDVRCRRATAAEAIAVWERLVEVAPDRAYLALRSARERLAARTGIAGALPGAVPPADRREPAGLARAARAVAPSRRAAASRATRSTCCSRRWSQNPHALEHPPGDLARARQLQLAAGAGRSLRRADAARRLLPRSARLHALPLPQHRAALAVPALPRLEHVRRGADRAGAGHRRDADGDLEVELRCSRSALDAFERPLNAAVERRYSAIRRLDAYTSSTCRSVSVERAVGPDHAVGARHLFLDRPLRGEAGARPRRPTGRRAP